MKAERRWGSRKMSLPLVSQFSVGSLAWTYLCTKPGLLFPPRPSPPLPSSLLGVVAEGDVSGWMWNPGGKDRRKLKGGDSRLQGGGWDRRSPDFPAA